MWFIRSSIIPSHSFGNFKDIFTINSGVNFFHYSLIASLRELTMLCDVVLVTCSKMLQIAKSKGSRSGLKGSHKLDFQKLKLDLQKSCIFLMG